MQRKWELAKEALRLLWARKYLWVFGIFVAGGGGGGVGGAPPKRDSAAAGAGGAESLGEVMSWLWPLIAGAALVALVVFVLHVASEAALIESVRAERGGKRSNLRGGFRSGFRHFGSVLGIKLAFGALSFVGAAVVGAPVLLGVLKVVPVALAVVVAVLLLVVAVPVLLTFYFTYEYALRFAVLDGRGAIAAWRAGWRHVHGRVLDSLQTLLLVVAGRAGGGMVALTLLLPAALVAVDIGFGVGWVPGVIVGATLGVPVVLAVSGATGAFTSSVWTLGFLDDREQVV